MIHTITMSVVCNLLMVPLLIHLGQRHISDLYIPLVSNLFQALPFLLRHLTFPQFHLAKYDTANLKIYVVHACSNIPNHELQVELECC